MTSRGDPPDMVDLVGVGVVEVNVTIDDVHVPSDDEGDTADTDEAPTA